MAGDLSKVVIPVVAEVDKSALDALGPAVRSAREAGAAGPTAAQAGGPQAVSVAGVVREMQALERSLHSLTGEIDRLFRVTQAHAHAAAGGGAPPPPSLLNVPGTTAPAASGGGAGAAPPGGGGSQTPPPAPAPGGGVLSTALGVFLGQFTERTLSSAIRASYHEVQRMADASRSIKEAAYLAASERGDAGDAPTLLGELRAGPGFPRKVMPESMARITQQLALSGVRSTGQDAMLLSELGLTTLGSPEAGAGFATSLFKDTRSNRALEILTSIDQYSKLNGFNTAEQVRQFEGLTGFFKNLQGAREVTPEQENRRLQLQGFYNTLPGDMGKGEGATRLQSQLFSASQSDPLARAALRREFRDETGLDPFTPEGAHQFALWQRSEKLAPAMLRASARYGGGDPHATALFRERHFGFTPEDAEALRTGSPDEQKALVARLGREAAERAVAHRARADASDPGARSIGSRAALQWNRVTEDLYSDLQVGGEEILSRIPYGSAAWEAAKGLPGAALGAGGVGGLFGARSLWRRLRGGRAAAGAAGPSARQALSLARAAKFAAGTAGVATVAGEVVHAAQTPGDDWKELLTRNLFPLVTSVVGGALFGPPGALGGYALGHGLQAGASSLFGGSTADAAIAPPGMRAVGGDGWTADAVAEHLGLLRAMAGGGFTTASLPGLGPTARQAGLAPMPMHGGDHVRPDDPRIVAAAERNHVPLELLQGLMEQESGFNPRAVSNKGAQGLGQLMPGTAKRWGVRNAFDIGENANGTAKHLRMLLDRYRGDETLALAAYNAGEGNVDKFHGIPPFKETRGFVTNVKRRARKFSAVDRAHLTRAMAAQDLPVGETAEAKAARDLREFERLAMDRHFGPEDDGQKVVVHLEPGPGMVGIVEPTRTAIPGPRRAR